MMKLLRTIRFDGTDPFVFERAAPPEDWAITGATPFAGLSPGDLVGKTRQAFANGFFAVPSFGFSTFATVAEARAEDRAMVLECLAAHYLEALGAPTEEAARETAEVDLTFTEDLCRDVPINTVFTLRRTVTDEGGIAEELRQIKPPSGEPIHARIWEVERDDD